MDYRADSVAQIVTSELSWGKPELCVTGVSTDSRTVRPGELFIALRGERFDGDQFIEAAYAAGAAVCIGHSLHPQGQWRDRAYIRVADGLMALQQLALHHRGQMICRMIAVTGSNGKTTVKELIHALCSSQFNTAKNPGNLNGQIGVPLSLLNTTKDHRVCVLEVGISAPGEMSRLVPLVRPDKAVLTNIGPVHLELLTDEQGVLREKGQLLEAVPASGSVVIDGDDPRICAFADRLGCSVVRVGFSRTNDYTAGEINALSAGRTCFTLYSPRRDKPLQVETGLAGRHNLKNILGAVAIADMFSLADDQILKALASFKPLAMRQEMSVLASGLTVINDAYNASPLSMRAALETLQSLPCKGRRVAILGEMLEIGPRSRDYHQELGRFIGKMGLDLLITIGPAGEWIATAAQSEMEEMKVLHYNNKDELIPELGSILGSDDLVLIKASRGVALESIVQALKDRADRPAQDNNAVESQK
ncbi:UDP-N-acetylmuramoyl-tripeptide--D-alanyl-D-alanine ligase [bacterium]|nr:UDP-N-acetylmuramoyl-tripeptide--D-alanyl-D-alanine ligase [bacterium]